MIRRVYAAYTRRSIPGVDTLIKPADEVEEKLAAGLGKGQISELVQDNEVHCRFPQGKCSIIASAAFTAISDNPLFGNRAAAWS
jgi:hypothetical protein